MRPILIDLDDDVHKEYLQLKERLKTRRPKYTVRQWFSEQVRIANRRFDRAEMLKARNGGGAG